MAEIIIETDRLVMRTQAEADFDIWMQHMNTPQVREYLGGLEEIHAVEAAFARSAACQAREGFSFWFVALKECGTLIGSCGLKHVDAEPAPEAIKGDVEIHHTTFAHRRAELRWMTTWIERIATGVIKRK